MPIGMCKRLDLRSRYGRRAIRTEVVSIRDLLDEPYTDSPAKIDSTPAPAALSAGNPERFWTRVRALFNDARHRVMAWIGLA